MSSNPREAVPALRLIAAQAEKLANDVESGRLWDGEFREGVAVIERALRDLPRERSGG